MYACRSEEDTRSHYRWCEPSCGCWELNSGPLVEQSVLLTSEPSLQPLIYYILPIYVVEYNYKVCYFCLCCGTFILMMQTCIALLYVNSVKCYFACLKHLIFLIQSWTANSKTEKRLGGAEIFIWKSKSISHPLNKIIFNYPTILFICVCTGKKI